MARMCLPRAAAVLVQVVAVALALSTMLAAPSVSAATTSGCGAATSATVFRAVTVNTVSNEFQSTPSVSGSEHVRGSLSQITPRTPIVDFGNASSVRFSLLPANGSRFMAERTLNMDSFQFIIDETYVAYRNNCLPNPCLNGGQCVEGVNQFRCICPATATGTTCQLVYSAVVNATTCPTAQQFFTNTKTKAIIVGNFFNYTMTPGVAPTAAVVLTFASSNTSVATVQPSTYTIPVGSIVPVNISVYGVVPGSINISVTISSLDPLWNSTAVPRTQLSVFAVNTTIPNNLVNGTNTTSPTVYVCCDPQLNPCLNGGSCVARADRRTYQCTCPPSFTGLHCGTPVWLVPTYYPKYQGADNVSADVCVSFDGLVGPPPEYRTNNVGFSLNGIYIRMAMSLNFVKRDTSERKGISFTAMHITLTPRIPLMRNITKAVVTTVTNTTTNETTTITTNVNVPLPPTYYERWIGTSYFDGSTPNLRADQMTPFLYFLPDSITWQSQVTRDSPKPVALGQAFPDRLTQSLTPTGPGQEAYVSSISLERGLIQLPRWRGIDTPQLFNYAQAVAQCAALPSASEAYPYHVCSQAELAATSARLNFSSCDAGWLSDTTTVMVSNGAGGFDAVARRLAGFIMTYVDPACGNATGFFGMDATTNPAGTGYFEESTTYRSVFCCAVSPVVDLGYYISTSYRLVAPQNHMFGLTFYPQYTSLSLGFTTRSRNTTRLRRRDPSLDVCIAFEDFSSTLLPRVTAASGTLDLDANVLQIDADLTLPGCRLVGVQVDWRTGAGAPLSVFPKQQLCQRSCNSSFAAPLVVSSFSGTFDDGSAGIEYSNNLACAWRIAPVAAERLTLRFNYLWTESNLDVIEVYDASTDGSDVGRLRGTFSGHQDVSALAPIVSDGPELILRFTSNPSQTYPGFSVAFDGCNSIRRCTGHGTCNSDGGCTCDYEYAGPECRSCYLGYKPSVPDQCTDGLLRAECQCILPPKDNGVRVKLRIRLDYSEVYSFEPAFIADVANSLDLVPSRISRVVVLSVDSTGFAQIEFFILPGRGLRPAERSTALTVQLNTEFSALRTSTWGSRIDPTFAAVLATLEMTQCKDGVYREKCPAPLVPKPTEEDTLYLYALAGLITGLIVGVLGVAYAIWRLRTAQSRHMQRDAKQSLQREQDAREASEQRERERQEALAEAERAFAESQNAMSGAGVEDVSVNLGPSARPSAVSTTGTTSAQSASSRDKGASSGLGRLFGGKKASATSSSAAPASSSSSSSAAASTSRQPVIPTALSNSPGADRQSAAASAKYIEAYELTPMSPRESLPEYEPRGTSADPIINPFRVSTDSGAPAAQMQRGAYKSKVVFDADSSLLM
ncbi:hypothetical protein CAOG_02764 [Capsaspora owczarzaki ATCC 30864]|uniref:EGF-like domain-containing protein n=1 Tax=Capsaspora owczarzaki (strain ATCC 30864) TaxID=595528 RepID=A0A0D2U9D4_CAPO3|nr:hypothetical protein CAOG_02764 [Capsaspora owczarzaki ATCC 30864]KJE91656.1 hypothetical protein CAOG_002764 [Capsaspora owczarzaki ATCC 30864]|eukprot:XP_004349517.1 hypothetical protein CAOG_02764 [Capsaspora owczarzaki ATCC 30864]